MEPFRFRNVHETAFKFQRRNQIDLPQKRQRFPVENHWSHSTWTLNLFKIRIGETTGKHDMMPGIWILNAMERNWSERNMYEENYWRRNVDFTWPCATQVGVAKKPYFMFLAVNRLSVESTEKTKIKEISITNIFMHFYIYDLCPLRYVCFLFTQHLFSI